jgi:hypothetical protein
MTIRFVTKTVHAFLDYPVAFNLIGTPFLLGLGHLNPIALWLSVVTGIAALLLTLVTDHATGLVRLLPYWLHLTVDRIVGVVFLAAPIVLGFTGIDAWFYAVNGAAVLLVTFLLNAPESSERTISAAHA